VAGCFDPAGEMVDRIEAWQAAEIGGGWGGSGAFMTTFARLVIGGRDAGK
jgi:hypothetical protein